MLIRKPADLRHSDVTPKQFYLNRRRFLAAGSAIAGAWALPIPASATMKLNNVTKSAYTVNEKITPKDDITSYNNYYEFGTDKGDPSHYANTLRPSPWHVVVGGLVNKPKTYDLDSIMKIAPLEERIYRHRCVEAIELPYVEGLRLDEAMHPLALLVVGLYGETLPNQNGAPFRLVVPWKYGFKSIKSIVYRRGRRAAFACDRTASETPRTWPSRWVPLH